MFSPVHMGPSQICSAKKVKNLVTLSLSQKHFVVENFFKLIIKKFLFIYVNISYDFLLFN